MKITAIGVDRRVYTHKILDRELKKSQRPNKQTWDANKDTGDVTFSWCKWSLDMRGNYQFSAQLSREEIVRLFVSSMSYVPLEKVVRLLGATLPNFHQLRDTTDLMIEMLCLMQALAPSYATRSRSWSE
ncbi:MAG: hypothetical protein ACREIR_00030 [Geminicoccaceae bacterium]